MALRYLFVQQAVNNDPPLLRKLYRLWNSYAEEVRPILDFDAAPGTSRQRGWGWAARALSSEKARPFEQALSDSLSCHNLDVPFVRDAVLFSFELWYGLNPTRLYEPTPQVFVPPTAAVVHRPEMVMAPVVQRSHRESAKVFHERVRKAFGEVLEELAEASEGGREVDADVVIRDVKWLAERVKGGEKQILRIAKREGYSPKAVRTHIAAAARIIGYPLPAAHVGRPRKQQQQIKA
jgi:hypothetical protein